MQRTAMILSLEGDAHDVVIEWDNETISTINNCKIAQNLHERAHTKMLHFRVLSKIQDITTHPSVIFWENLKNSSTRAEGMEL